MQFSAYDVICASKYGEIVDATLTLRLAEIQAKLVRSDPDQAMRICAGAMARRVQMANLKYKLIEMVIADYPGNMVIEMEKQIDIMVETFIETSGVSVEADSLDDLKELIGTKPKPQPFIPYLVKP